MWHPCPAGSSWRQPRHHRGGVVSFSGNYGHGFWEDMSVYNSVFRQSDFSDNIGTGLFLEISARVIVGDNTFARNGEFGIKVNNTSNVKIWNNTFVGNGRPLNIVQDSRRNTNRYDQAVDQRIAWPDPEMPWTLGPVTIRNNVDRQRHQRCELPALRRGLQRTPRPRSRWASVPTATSTVGCRASQPTWLADLVAGRSTPTRSCSPAGLSQVDHRPGGQGSRVRRHQHRRRQLQPDVVGEFVAADVAVGPAVRRRRPRSDGRPE